MDNENVFDQLEKQTEIQLQLTTERKRYLIRILILIVINTILFVLFIKGRGFTDNLLAVLNANFIGFNILGFILGTIVAAFPYKGLNYSKKYFRASLLSILTIQSIMTIGLILIAIMTLVGWY